MTKLFSFLILINTCVWGASLKEASEKLNHQHIQLSTQLNSQRSSIFNERKDLSSKVEISKANSLEIEIISLKSDIKELNKLLEDTSKHMTTTEHVVPFGFKPIDDLTGGMTRGEITVIAGRPGHFKSTMTINIVSNLLNKGLKVLVFNREMSADPK